MMTPQESMAKKNSLSMVQTRKDYSERQSRKKEQHGGERKNSMVEKERTAWWRQKEQHGGERKNSMVEMERSSMPAENTAIPSIPAMGRMRGGGEGGGEKFSIYVSPMPR